MKTSKNIRPRGEDPIDRPLKAGSAHAAISVFCIDVCNAFAEAGERQRGSLACSEDRLAELARRSRMLVEPDTIRGLTTEITQCVADAAGENVRIWSDLMKRVQTGRARMDEAVAEDRQIVCDRSPVVGAPEED